MEIVRADVLAATLVNFLKCLFWEFSLLLEIFEGTNIRILSGLNHMPHFKPRSHLFKAMKDNF